MTHLQLHLLGAEGQVLRQRLDAVKVEPLVDWVELARHCLHHLHKSQTMLKTRGAAPNLALHVSVLHRISTLYLSVCGRRGRL